MVLECLAYHKAMLVISYDGREGVSIASVPKTMMVFNRELQHGMGRKDLVSLAYR
jgi:hypothetical protein